MSLNPARLRFASGGIAAAALASFTLLSPAAGQKPAAATPRAAQAAAARPAPGGLHTGIRVHGKWTIVVKNKDGSIAATRHFENALQVDGMDALPLLLAGFAAPGAWAVYLGANASGVQPCNTASFATSTAGGVVTDFYGPCYAVQAGGMYGPGNGCQSYMGATCSSNLTVSVVSVGTLAWGNASVNEVGLQLTGGFRVEYIGQLGSVGTSVGLCIPSDSNPQSGISGLAPANVSAQACITSATDILAHDFYNGYSWDVTSTTIPGGPIDVIPDQSVEVTVVISFS